VGLSPKRASSSCAPKIDGKVPSCFQFDDPEDDSPLSCPPDAHMVEFKLKLDDTLSVSSMPTNFTLFEHFY